MAPDYLSTSQHWRVRVCIGFLLWLAVVPAVLAQSCPSSDGTGYTYVTNGGSGSYNVGNGQSLLISSGIFTGSLDGPASGGLVCVNTGAVFQPGTVNNMAGTVRNFGTTTLSGINFGGGTMLENNAGATMNLAGTNANGAVALTNAATATLQVSGGNISMPGGSSFLNLGTAIVASGTTIDLQSGANAENRGTIQLNGGALNLSGTALNSGFIHDFGDIHVNGGGSFTNDCSIVSTQFLSSGTLVNRGQIIVAGAGEFNINSGSVTQGPDAVIAGVTFINDGAVSGFGRYHFTGETRNQGAFNGSSPTDPINFYDATQTNPPNIFDSGNAPTNTIRQSFVPPSVSRALNNCFAVPATADVAVSKSNQVDEVVAGATTTYTLTVVNNGPDGAEGSLLRDTPGTGLTCSTVACTGSSGGATCPAAGSGSGELSLANLLGGGVSLQLPAGGQIVFELTCTVDDGP